MKQYCVIDWDNQLVLKSFDKLSSAKTYCKKLGFIVDNTNTFIGNPPIAYVGEWNQSMGLYTVTYNPRFPKTK